MARRLGGVFLLITIVTTLGITSIALIQRELTEYRNQVTPLMDTSQAARLAFTRGEAALRGYLASGQADFLPALNQARYDFERSAGQLDALGQAGIPEQSRQQLRATSRRWMELANDGITRRNAGRSAHLAPTTAAGEAVHAELDAIDRRVSAVRAERRQGYQGVISAGLWLTIGATLIALAIGVWLAVQIIRQVARPIRALRDVVAAHADGSDDARADVLLGTHEVQQVARAFNVLADDRQRSTRRQAWDLRLHAATDEIATALTAAPTTDVNWRPACERLGTVLGMDSVLVYSWSDADGFAPLGGWASATYQGARLVVPQAVAEATRALDGPLTAANPAQMAATFPEGLVRAARREGVRAWTLRPLIVGDSVVGVASVWSTSDHCWEPEEIEAVDRFTFYAARTITEQRYVESLRHLDVQKSDFLATTSHELRTPLTSVAGYLEMLEDGDFGELTPGQAQAWDIIGRNVARLRALIEDLLIINQLDSGKGSTVHSTHPVSDVVADVTRILTPTADARGVELVVHRVGDGLHIRGERTQLARALTNVVGNGLKFTPAGGRVTISVDRDGELVHIACADTGIGIPTQDQQALFTRFFRASNATAEQIQGTGLGLTIAKAIIDGHGGSVAVRSKLGEGTTLILTLPLADTPQTPAGPDTAADVNATALPHGSDGAAQADERGVGAQVTDPAKTASAQATRAAV